MLKRVVHRPKYNGTFSIDYGTGIPCTRCVCPTKDTSRIATARRSRHKSSKKSVREDRGHEGEEPNKA